MKGDGQADMIKKAFGERTYEKGLGYFKEGRVGDLVVDGDKVSGKVIGSADKPYHVKLTWGKMVSSTCSCPVGEMCKHGAALTLAFLSNDMERVDLEKVRKEIEGLDDNEAKGLLAECMAREPRLIRLLQAMDDGPRVERALSRLDRSCANARRFGPAVWSYDEVDLEIKNARRWRGDGADRDRVELVLKISEELVDHIDDGWDEYDDEGVYGTAQSCTALLRDCLKTITEDDLLRLLERLIDLNEKDEYDIGTAEMLDIVAARIDPEDMMSVLNRYGSEGYSKSRIKTLKDLTILAFRRSGDVIRAAELLIENSATREEHLRAAEMLIEAGGHQRARAILKDHDWDKGDLQRASLLLRANEGTPLKTEDIDVKGLLLSLDRSVSKYSGNKDIDLTLSVLRNVLDDEVLLRMTRESLPDGPAKLILLAKLGKAEEMEALYLKDKQRYQPISWMLARACLDSKVTGRMALRAASQFIEYLNSEDEAVLLWAVKECDIKELRLLSKFMTNSQGLVIRIFDALAERDPAMARDFLEERFGQVDLEHVIQAVDHLNWNDRKSAVDLGVSWVRRKLDMSPRYEYILTMLLKVKEVAGSDDWAIQRKVLREEYPDRKRLLEVLNRIG